MVTTMLKLVKWQEGDNFNSVMESVRGIEKLFLHVMPVGWRLVNPLKKRIGTQQRIWGACQATKYKYFTQEEGLNVNCNGNKEES